MDSGSEASRRVEGEYGEDCCLSAQLSGQQDREDVHNRAWHGGQLPLRLQDQVEDLIGQI